MLYPNCRLSKNWLFEMYSSDKEPLLISVKSFVFALGKSISFKYCNPKIWKKSESQKFSSIISKGLFRPADRIILYSISFNFMKESAACFSKSIYVLNAPLKVHN